MSDIQSTRGTIGPEDYVEPRCVLCETPYGAAPEIKAIPQQRVIEKMNEYMSRRDYAGAERHLKYWLEEAILGHDEGGELMVRNELVGHYRKVGDREKALENGEKAISLLEKLDLDGTVSAGTTYVNVATALNAFGENERSLTLFQKALSAYEEQEEKNLTAGQMTAPGGVDPALLGGLYNNMALTEAALKRYKEARAHFESALAKMKLAPGGELEQAITWLNIANVAENEHGLEQGEAEIFDCLDRAWDLLDGPGFNRDGYYAFVCEKCAPTFAYYGYFAAEQELKKRAEEIYNR